MFPSVFPSPFQSTDPNGLIACSREITMSWLLDAYAHAIFPWPVEEGTVLWFSPPERGILEFSRLHIPKRLARFIKRCGFTLKIDQDFAAVLDACASVPRPEGGTWITDTIRSAYREFHRIGYAHSFETYDAGGRLVGGLYGVGFDHFFGGESMFHYESGASKFALLGAVATLRRFGLTWMDTQMVTPITASFGAENVSRSLFWERFERGVQNLDPIPTRQLRESLVRPEELVKPSFPESL